MRVFIVHAHPEPKSFNGAMTREAAQALMAAGHDVTISDLYAMAFNPVSDRRNFVTVKDADYYRQQNEEAYATTHDGFAQDIQAEMDNTRSGRIEARIGLRMMPTFPRSSLSFAE